MSLCLEIQKHQNQKPNSYKYKLTHKHHTNFRERCSLLWVWFGFSCWFFISWFHCKIPMQPLPIVNLKFFLGIWCLFILLIFFYISFYIEISSYPIWDKTRHFCSQYFYNNFKTESKVFSVSSKSHYPFWCFLKEEKRLWDPRCQKLRCMVNKNVMHIQ